MRTRTSDFRLHTSHSNLTRLVLSAVQPYLCAVSQAALKGGCAKVNITPPLGITLIGSQGKPSDAVMDDLYAKAMVLSDGRTTIAIVSIDLLYTSLEEITDPVRAIVHEKLGIPRQNIMVCATHTHSGPQIFATLKLPALDRVVLSDLAQAYRQVLVRKMADCVLAAHRDLRDVKIGVAVGEAPEVLFNRRPVAKERTCKDDLHAAAGGRGDAQDRNDGRGRHESAVQLPVRWDARGIRPCRSPDLSAADGGYRRPDRWLFSQFRLPSGQHLSRLPHGGFGGLSGLRHADGRTGRGRRQPLCVGIGRGRGAHPAECQAAGADRQGGGGRSGAEAPIRCHHGRCSSPLPLQAGDVPRQEAACRGRERRSRLRRRFRSCGSGTSTFSGCRARSWWKWGWRSATRPASRSF